MTDSPLTAASEKLLSDFDRHPDAIDHSELSARLWLIEREAATRAKASGEGLRAGDCAYQCPHTEDAHRLDLDHEFVPAQEAAAGEDWYDRDAKHYARTRAATQEAAAGEEHEHYWVDARDDETGWHCVTCGVTEYPGDPADHRGDAIDSQ